MDMCQEHSGICQAIEALKERIARTEALNEKEHAAHWRAIDRMRGWVISGMGAFIIGVFTWVLSSLHIIK